MAIKHKLKSFKFIGFIALGMGCLINSCKNDCHEKGNCSPVYYRNALGEAKEYFWAGEGSYWIYKNTKTGDLDTQTVLACRTYWVHDQGTTKYTNNITIDYEVIIREIYSTFNKWNYIDKSNFYNPDALREYKTFIERTVPGEGINNPFWSPSLIKEKGGTSSSVTTCVNVDTSIICGGTLYNKCIVFNVNIDEIWEEKLRCIRPNTRYYWVKNIGLIKRELRNCNYSWELVDYKILP